MKDKNKLSKFQLKRNKKIKNIYNLEKKHECKIDKCRRTFYTEYKLKVFNVLIRSIKEHIMEYDPLNVIFPHAVILFRIRMLDLFIKKIATLNLKMI